MATTRAFDTYTVQIHGGAKGRIALLLCYKGTTYIGKIAFYQDGVDLVPDFIWYLGQEDLIVLIMPMSRFNAVMSTVRQEKPLALYIDVNRGPGIVTTGHGYLTTSEREPVGEEEGMP